MSDISIKIDNILFIPYMIHCAKSGCQKSARELIGMAASYFSDGEDLPETLKIYITEAFRAIEQGKKADQALFLSHGRGKNDTALYRKQAIANEVARLYWIGEAKTIDEACDFVSVNGVKKIVADGKGDMIFVDVKTARKYYYEIYPGTPQRRPEE